MADWSGIPAKESAWIRGLLENRGCSILTVLPCMRDELLMPRSVFECINSGRGQIQFYANVEHALLCPRFCFLLSAICFLLSALCLGFSFVISLVFSFFV